MKRALSAVSLAAAAALLYACTDTTGPTAEELADHELATTISATSVDPNAETAGGHTATDPKSTATMTCTYDATSQWTTCTSTQNGMTISRQVQFLTATGATQQKPDANTVSMKSKTSITGTIVRTGTSFIDSTKVNRTSDETVTGLGPSSTSRVVNGTASGTEDSKVIDSSRGTMTMQRVYADTTNALTFTSPPDMTKPWPVSGSIIRSMTATGKLNDGPSKTYSSRIEQTFAAGGLMTIKTTVNGVTHTCTVQLGGTAKPTCS